MYQSGVEKAKNLLRVAYSGAVGPEETRRCAEDLLTFLPFVTPGFRLLADFSKLDRMDVACAPDIKRMMDLCNEQGVKHVVRVIPDPSKDIGMKIMSLFHYRKDVEIITCETLEEGLRILAVPA